MKKVLQQPGSNRNFFLYWDFAQRQGFSMQISDMVENILICILKEKFLLLYHFTRLWQQWISVPISESACKHSTSNFPGRVHFLIYQKCRLCGPGHKIMEYCLLKLFYMTTLSLFDVYSFPVKIISWRHITSLLVDVAPSNDNLILLISLDSFCYALFQYHVQSWKVE